MSVQLITNTQAPISDQAQLQSPAPLFIDRNTTKTLSDLPAEIQEYVVSHFKYFISQLETNYKNNTGDEAGLSSDFKERIHIKISRARLRRKFQGIFPASFIVDSSQKIIFLKHRKDNPDEEIHYIQGTYKNPKRTCGGLVYAPPNKQRKHDVHICFTKSLKTIQMLHALPEEDKRFLHIPTISIGPDNKTKGATLAMVSEKMDSDFLEWRLAATTTQQYQVFYDVARGISALHRNGICQLDIKPCNMLIKNNRGYVSDLDGALHKDVHDFAPYGESFYLIPEKRFPGRNPHETVWNTPEKRLAADLRAAARTFMSVLRWGVFIPRSPFDHFRKSTVPKPTDPNELALYEFMLNAATLPLVDVVKEDLTIDKLVLLLKPFAQE